MNANLRVSNHKQATQLLQTELQDSRAQVEEKENTIQTLRSKLRESEVCPEIRMTMSQSMMLYSELIYCNY